MPDPSSDLISADHTLRSQRVSKLDLCLDLLDTRLNAGLLPRTVDDRSVVLID